MILQCVAGYALYIIRNAFRQATPICKTLKADLDFK